MIASEIAKDALLPFIISRIGVQSIESGMASRNPNRTGEFGRNATNTLNPRESVPTRSTPESRLVEINERRVARGEVPINRDGTPKIASNALDDRTIAQ
jgi:hypothetical protein